MWHGWAASDKFVEVLCAMDAGVADRVRAAGCPHCGGRMDQAHYPRKPRAGTLGAGLEGFTTRLSFCCAREGCRRRATPPSVRFLGRKVYAGAVVVVAAVRAVLEASWSRVRAETGVPVRTIRRWLTYWQTLFVATALWRSVSDRFVPSVDTTRLPLSVMERFATSDRDERVSLTLRLVAPVTTRSVADGGRFVRDG